MALTVISFNPYRVFRFVATPTMPDDTDRCCHIVSIPVGFSGSLQRQRCCCAIRGSVSFNPCRVFRFAATGDLFDMESVEH